MKIGIIDYQAGNLQSVYNIIYNLGYNPMIIKNYREIKNIEKLIIPGVGSANIAIRSLKKSGLKNEILNHYEKEKYILGICLGFQIFAKKLFENGLSEGLDVIDGEVIEISNNAFNIGWSDVEINKNNCLNINQKFSNFYFCHSYYLKFNSNLENSYCIGKIKFKDKIIPSIYTKKKFIGTQFHPEKSQLNGSKFIQNFLEL